MKTILILAARYFIADGFIRQERSLLVQLTNSLRGA